MSLANYKRFHDTEQAKLLRQLSGAEDLTGSRESEIGREYAEAEAATANWEQRVEDERNGGKIKRGSPAIP